MRTSLPCWALALTLASTASAVTISLPTHLGPTDFDTTAFPNVLVAGSLSNTSLTFGSGVGVTLGPFTLAQGQPFVTGSDITQGLALGAGPTGGIPDFIVPGFGNISIINGPGADLVIFEAGSPSEPIRLSLSLDGGATFSANIDFATTPTVPLDTSSGFATNTVFIDLTDFGILAGQKVDALRLQGIFTGVGGSGPDILAIGVLNFDTPTGNIPGDVPEPSTVVTVGCVLMAAAIWRKRS